MDSETAAAPRRKYSSSRRSMQAAQTRRDVVMAAIGCFGETGWTGTTLAALAERAGVAVETLYSGFGSKKGLLRAAFEAAVVGDAEPVPLAERDVYRQLGEGTLDQRMAKGAILTADIHERSAALARALAEAAAGDPEVEVWRAELEHGRRLELARSLELVTGKKVRGAHLDLLWALFSPEVWLKLVEEAGMSRATYERTLTDATLRILDLRSGVSPRAR